MALPIQARRKTVARQVHTNLIYFHTCTYIHSLTHLQLFDHTPSASNGYSNATQCKELGRFISLLHEIDHPTVHQQLAEEHEGRVIAGSHKRRHVTKYIVLDDADRLRTLVDATMMHALLRLQQLTQSNVCVVLVTNVLR